MLRYMIVNMDQPGTQANFGGLRTTHGVYYAGQHDQHTQ